MSQEQVRRQKTKSRAEEANVEETGGAANAELAEKTDETLASIDDVLDDQLDAELLDAIDDVLEEDAEGFVTNFVQAGGE